LKFEIENEI
jgi:hypothetical protein